MKSANAESTAFAGILHTAETSGKVSCRLRVAEVTSSSLVGSTYFFSEFAGKTKRGEKSRAGGRARHKGCHRPRARSPGGRREAGHTLQPLRTRALRPRCLRAVPGGRARGPRALRGGDREVRRQHTGLGRRKWPGSTAPSRTDEGRERIRDVRDRCIR